MVETLTTACNKYIMQFNLKEYILKIWLTSVLISPIILLIAYVALSKVGPHDVPIFILMLPIGAMCSLPSLITLYIVLRYFSSRFGSIFQLKLVTAIMGLLLSYLPFFVINDYRLSMNRTTSAVCAVYALSITAGVWLFKIKRYDDSFAKTEVTSE